MKKRFYVWLGQNATCGEPNMITGRLSRFGDVLIFSTKAKRDAFIEDYYDPNGNKRAVAGSKKDMRGYNLGMSVRAFEEYISYLTVDEAVREEE